MQDIETGIDQWRDFIRRSPPFDEADTDELESHLRDQIADLTSSGLAADEALLIAVKRLGQIDDIANEFAREHSGRLWKQLVFANGTTDHAESSRGVTITLAFAVAAALSSQIARLAAGFPANEPWWLFRNAALFVVPFLAAYFAWHRRLSVKQWLVAGAALLIAGVMINVYPSQPDQSTAILAAMHLPVCLWFIVAYPYMGGAWRSHDKRMDFVRFTGEFFIYYVLIALGGAVLMGLTAGILAPAGIDAERLIEWVVPTGAAGAVIVAAWLVETKQRVIENMAPVLTMIFTPLFAVMLVGAAIVYAITGLGGTFDRELLVVFDILMVVVLGLVLYGMSARDSSRPAGWMDRIQLIAVIGALVLDLMVLGMMIGRISEFGWTPNRVAALGLNLLLLVNLSGAAWLSSRFLAGLITHHELQRWQTSYLPAFAAWSAAVVILLPPIFNFS